MLFVRVRRSAVRDPGQLKALVEYHSSHNARAYYCVVLVGLLETFFYLTKEAAEKVVQSVNRKLEEDPEDLEEAGQGSARRLKYNSAANSTARTPELDRPVHVREAGI